VVLNIRWASLAIRDGREAMELVPKRNQVVWDEVAMHVIIHPTRSYRDGAMHVKTHPARWYLDG